MRLTRRGWVAVAVVAVGVANAVAYGPRALNAVVVPVGVALLVAGIQVWRLPAPTVVRDPPPDGFPDETHAVTLDVDVGRPFPATTVDALSAGLVGDAAVDAVVGDDPLTYEVTYWTRGPATVGPTTVVARDLLGLVTREFVGGGTDEVLVFPRVRALTAPARRDLAALYDPRTTDDRGEFDRLREYTPGDPLRDVHWKSSAKSGDLVVKSFAGYADPRTVSVSVGGREGTEDDVAEAAAAVCCALLDAGAPIRVTTPGGAVDAGPADRRRLLEHLARVESGPVPDGDAAVVVRGTASGARVSFGGRETTFDRLRVNTSRPAGFAAVRADDAGADADADADESLRGVAR